jgi:dienelactone hydrolase
MLQNEQRDHDQLPEDCRASWKCGGSWDEIRSRGATLEIHIYSGAGHAWDRKNLRKHIFNEHVNKDSHKRTIKFFQKYMK